MRKSVLSIMLSIPVLARILEISRLDIKNKKKILHSVRQLLRIVGLVKTKKNPFKRSLLCSTDEN